MLGVTILGNNSAIPAHDRHPTAQILTLHNELILIDCGEGTQVQIAKYKIKYNKINHIFISHLHGDHYFGLIGLITSWGLMNRDHDLHLYAPPLLKNIIDLQLTAASTSLPYNLIFHPLGSNGIIADEANFTVESFSTKHRIPCWGFIFREKKRPRRLNLKEALKYNIAESMYANLQKGEDVFNRAGELIKNAAVTTSNTAAKSYVFCGDTKYDESLIDIVKNTQLMYHETTYLKNLNEKATMRFHSTTEQAATLAAKAGVQQLIIGHFSSNYSNLDEFVTESRAVFPNTHLALEGLTFRL